MRGINLSYILSTRNRLPFLQITLSKLIQGLKVNEEIVIVDGDSNDGTKEYLQKLFDAGKIHQYISEKDKNQAHGWNKAMLLAKGTIIKKIIDDDVFDYHAIRTCATYMLENPAVDVIISNDLAVNLSFPNVISKHSRLNHYQNWVHGKQPSFTFGDVHLLIKKSALAYVGLYNTNFIMMDWEYSLRISHLKANIVYYTGYNALSVFHPGTVSANKSIRTITNQGRKTALLYGYAGDEAEISMWSKIKIAVGKKIYKQQIMSPTKLENEDEIVNLYEDFQNQLHKINKQNEGKFISNNG